MNSSTSRAPIFGAEQKSGDVRASANYTSSVSPARGFNTAFVVAWLFCLLFYFMEYAVRSAPSVMLPELTAAFGLTMACLSSLVGLYYYTYALFAIVAGASVDRWGRRRAVYNQNEAGSTKEEREIAKANVVLAEAALADLEAKFAKTKHFAPADGVIGTLAFYLGEVISPGQSVMTMSPQGERWFTFAVREDFLKGTTIGSSVRFFHAKGNTIEARVTELRPLGEFATWRAARAVGDHDLNSFLVRADPLGANEELQPGMTVWLEPLARAPTK
jgi:hypothetical protein